MLNRQITTTSFGQRYTFRLRNSGSLPKSLVPERFSDLSLALQFVRTLNLPTSHWRSFTHFGSTLNYSGWRSSNPWAKIDHFIARCLVRGEIQAFKIRATVSLVSSKAQRQFKNDYGKSYHFFPASSLLSSKPKKVESITTKESALTLIKKLNLSKPQLIELNKALDLPCDVDYLKLNDILSEALANSEVIIVTEEPHLKSSPDQDASSEAATDSAADTSPHPTANSGSSDDSDKNKDDEEKVICKLTKLIVSCAHDGRKQEVTSKSAATPTLDVVASETATRGFDKIKATIEVDAPCGSHTSSSSSISPKPAKTVKGSLENTYHLACSPVSNPLRYLWLPSIKPTTYKIAASSCERFSPASVAVNVYPKIKWNVAVGYSFGREDASQGSAIVDGNKVAKNEHKSNAGKFVGKMEYHYDEDKRDFTNEYKNGIDEILTNIDGVRDKVDTFLSKLGEDAPVKLKVFWPQLNIKYETELAEDSASAEVNSSYALSVSANPLIGLRGSLDLFPVILKAAKANPAAASIASILEVAMDGVGHDEGVASLKADIQLLFKLETKVTIDFSTKGHNGKDDAKAKAEQAIEMVFKLEGIVGVKGHAWIIKFQKSYRAGIKTGFVGKVVVERDDVGYFWYSRFLFNGLVVYFTKYEKLEKSVEAADSKRNKYKKLPDKLMDTSTREWTWIEPDPDDGAPSDTDTPAGTAATQSANKHYIIKF